MKIPTITGVIDRRILINYRVDKEVLRKYLPHPFRPKLVHNAGMAGICLIRLKEIRPKGIPAAMGVSSENGAHRIAVEWTENGMVKEGVFIPRRDTVVEVHSSFFENKKGFPEGSITFDNALLMKNIHHEWRSLGSSFS